MAHKVKKLCALPKFRQTKRYYICQVPARYIPGYEGEGVKYPVLNDPEELGFFESIHDAKKHLREKLGLKKLPAGTVVAEADPAEKIEDLREENEDLTDYKGLYKTLVGQVEDIVNTLTTTVTAIDVKDFAIQLKQHGYLTKENAIGAAVLQILAVEY